MAAPLIRNVFLRANQCFSKNILNNYDPQSLYQCRGKRTIQRVKWLIQSKGGPKDSNLTQENKEFLDDVVADLYSKVPAQASPLQDGPWKRQNYTKYTMRTGVLAMKIGIVPQWRADGTRFTTTLLQIIDNHVIKYTPAEEFCKSLSWKPWWGKKYGSVTVGAISSDPRLFTKEYNNLFLEAGVPPKKRLTRFLVTRNSAIQPGTPLNVMHFRVGDRVDCSAQTIHHGFQGVVKRYGYKGGPRSHGVTKTHRKVGATATGLKRGLWKGKKMAGIMGGNWRTIKGYKIVRINTKYNVLYVQGQNIPGDIHGYVRVFDTNLPLRRKEITTPPPMPTWYPEDTTEQLQEEYFAEDVFQFDQDTITFSAEESK